MPSTTQYSKHYPRNNTIAPYTVQNKDDMVNISGSTLRNMRKKIERTEKENKSLRLRIKELEDGQKTGSTV